MRPAKTIRQHLLEGTVPQGKAQLDSKYAGGRPRFPRHLSPEARAEYKRAVRFLEKRGTLTEGDYGTLSIYASVFARWLQAKAEVGSALMVDVIVTDSSGVVHTSHRLNPLLKVLEACESRLLALGKSLGLTPADREKVKPAAPVAPKEAELIPGSMGWILAEQARDAREMKPLVFIRPEDMTAQDSEPTHEEEPTNVGNGD